jgi:hypothetical protein
MEEDLVIPDSRLQRKRRRRQGLEQSYIRGDRRFGSIPFKQTATRSDEGVVYQSAKMRMVELDEKLDSILFKTKYEDRIWVDKKDDPHAAHRAFWGPGASNAIKAPFGRKIEAYADGEGQRQANIFRRRLKTVPVGAAAGALIGGALGTRRALADDYAYRWNHAHGNMKPANDLAAKNMKAAVKGGKNSLVTSDFAKGRPLKPFEVRFPSTGKFSIKRGGMTPRGTYGYSASGLPRVGKGAAGAAIGGVAGAQVGKFIGGMFADQGREQRERSAYWDKAGKEARKKRKR